MRILVTGGSGFIGTNLCLKLLEIDKIQLLNIDKQTYAANAQGISILGGYKNYIHSKTDICDESKLTEEIKKFKPHKIIHLAAESHVDRSVQEPKNFIMTNVFGTYNLLNVCLNYWNTLEVQEKNNFLFHHVSTDEVFGSLGEDGLFTENSPFDPSSPYSASKASSDHFVSAWHRTYGLPVVITNCSNNYGPYQDKEKLVPKIIHCMLNKKEIPVYGDGKNVRDWLYVSDHVDALWTVLTKGKKGERYNIGGNTELTNLKLINLLSKIIGRKIDENPEVLFNLINMVSDRPGHDRRYAIDCTKLSSYHGWHPSVNIEKGLDKTVDWYLGLSDF